MKAIRPDLDGTQIMEILGLEPGRVVGRAYKFLMEIRMEEGPIGPEAAEERLRDWWSQQPESAPGTGGH